MPTFSKKPHICYSLTSVRIIEEQAEYVMYEKQQFGMDFLY